MEGGIRPQVHLSELASVVQLVKLASGECPLVSPCASSSPALGSARCSCPTSCESLRVPIGEFARETL